MTYESSDHIKREVELRRERLDTCDETLNVRASDHATVAELLKDLDSGGTADLHRSVQEGVEGAERTIRDQFDADHAETSREVEDAQQVADEVRDVAAREAENAERLADARGDLCGDDAKGSLEKLEARLQESSDVVRDEAERLRVRQEQSEREAERLLHQVVRSRTP